MNHNGKFGLMRSRFGIILVQVAIESSVEHLRIGSSTIPAWHQNQIDTLDAQRMDGYFLEKRPDPLDIGGFI